MRLDWEAHGILADFRRCQTTCQNTDLVFHCSNGKVFAHQMIFAGISRLFKNLMQRYLIGQELIPLDMNISLPGIRRKHVAMVVKMVYAGQVSLTKSDYTSFREICQLLELRIPISDYDEFFKKKKDDKSKEAQISQVSVSIPLKSWSDSRVFVCDQCYSTFPLKIALNRHKQRRHGQSQELQTPITPEPPKVSQPPKVSRFNQRGLKKRSLTSSNHSFYPKDGEPAVECPDCLSRCRPRRVREHLAHHLRGKFMAFVTASESVPGRNKCQSCDYEAVVASDVCRHLGLYHNLVAKFANEAQRKFLLDGRKMLVKRGRAAIVLPTSPDVVHEMEMSKESNPAGDLEVEDLSEIGDNSVKIDIDNAMEDATNIGHS